MMQEKVDVAILEVGVGGEYDSTNIVENPIVCGITALGLDHVTVLGNTIDSIAWHKAGIIKVPNPRKKKSSTAIFFAWLCFGTFFLNSPYLFILCHPHFLEQGACYSI